MDCKKAQTKNTKMIGVIVLLVFCVVFVSADNITINITNYEKGTEINSNEVEFSFWLTAINGLKSAGLYVYNIAEELVFSIIKVFTGSPTEYEWNITTELADGEYEYFINVTDDLDETITSQNTTILINTSFPVTLNSPANDSLESSPVTFNCSANIDEIHNIINLSLYTNESGSWQIKNTTNSSLQNYYTFDNFTFNDRFGNINFTNNGMTNGNGIINEGIVQTSDTQWAISNSQIQYKDNWTTSIWFNYSGVSEESEFTIFGTTNSFRLRANILSNDKIEIFYDFYSGFGSCPTTDCFQGSTSITTGDFHNLVLKANSSGLFIYLDGSYEGNISKVVTSTTLENTTLVLDFGDGSYLNGTVDEFGFWNTDISTDKITQLYNSGSASRLFNNITETIDRTVSNNSIIWNCEACNENNACSFATENFTLTVDDEPPTIVIENPNGTLNYNYIGNNETLNVTFTDGNLSECWYNYNGTNISIDGCVSGVKNSTQFILEANNLNITIYANDTFGNLGSELIEWDYNLLENSVEFSQETTSGTPENFIINITISDSFSGISMLLNYNGTNYSMSSSDAGLNREYSVELIAPIVSSETNITFFYIELLSGSNITREDTREFNQTVSQFLIDDCSVFNNVLIDFKMLNEDTLNEINGTIEITVNLFSLGTTDLVNSFNNSFDYVIGEDSQVCLDNITGKYSMSYQIRHFGDESQYFKKYRNVQLTTIDSSIIPENITLYNLNLSRGNSFNIIVVGNLLTSVGNTGLLVDTQRQYLATNEFRSVESPITDSSGVAIANLVETEEIYNFLVSFNGELLGTFNNYQVKCANAALGQCSITLNLATATGEPIDFDTFGNITQVFLLDTDENILHHTFSSTDGTSKTVRSLVIKNDGYANETICDSSTSGTSGTILCPIGVAYRNVSIMIQTFIDDDMLGTKQITQGPDVEWQGADILIMLLMFSSLTLLFLAHPITIVLGSVLGLAIPVIFITSAEASFGTLFGAVLFYIAGGIVAIIIIAKKKN